VLPARGVPHRPSLFWRRFFQFVELGRKSKQALLERFVVALEAGNRGRRRLSRFGLGRLTVAWGDPFSSDTDMRRR